MEKVQLNIVKKEIIIVTGEFYPIKSSGAFMLDDLALEISSRGIDVTVLTTSNNTLNSNDEKINNNIKIIRCYTFCQKSKSKYLRLLSEVLTPYLMLISLTQYKIRQKKWDMVIWYSPTIFLGKVIGKLRLKVGGSKYLILRDIFPEWAVYLGLIDKKSIINYFFRRIAKTQYLLADIIGVQAHSDINILRNYEIDVEKITRILENWVTYRPLINSNIDIVIKKLFFGKKIAIYAGNMGVAQNAIIFLKIAEYFLISKDVVFVFIGRGNQKSDMEELARARSLVNVYFLDEVSAENIYRYYEKSTIGLLSLDGRHRSSNIPGKFISYVAAGLPVYAIVNKGNDLIDIINHSNVGKAITYDSSIKYMSEELQILINNTVHNSDIRKNCKNLYNTRYTTAIAADNILAYIK